MLDALIATMTHTRNQTLKLVADLSEKQMVAQPAAHMNHPAWVLGHLLLVEYNFLRLVNNGQGPQAEAGWAEVYGMKSVPSPEGAKYVGKEIYLAKLVELRAQIIARLKVMSPEDFAQPHPDPARRERFPTIGHAAMFYSTWHEAYHAGQLSAWRRALGLPPV